MKKSGGGNGIMMVGKMVSKIGKRLVVGIVKDAEKKFCKAFEEGRRERGDWEYEAQVEFFGLKEKKPEVKCEDFYQGNVRVFQKSMEVEEWNMKVEAFEKFTGKKFRK